MKIDVIDLRLDYKDGSETQTIFQKTNVSIESNTPNIIVGPSGSGKSSLLYLLSSLRMPTSGVIKYSTQQGQFTKVDEKFRYENFGFIFQQPYLIPYLSVSENIALARSDKDLSKEIREWLERLQLTHLANKYPHQLSGGEKQRIAIIRALIKKPLFVFADEPTASLDKKNAEDIYSILTDECKKKTLVIATHDMSLLNGTERILQIKDKTIE